MGIFPSQHQSSTAAEPGIDLVERIEQRGWPAFAKKSLALLERLEQEAEVCRAALREAEKAYSLCCAETRFDKEVIPGISEETHGQRRKRMREAAEGAQLSQYQAHERLAWLERITSLVALISQPFDDAAVCDTDELKALREEAVGHATFASACAGAGLLDVEGMRRAEEAKRAYEVALNRSVSLAKWRTDRDAARVLLARELAKQPALTKEVSR